MDDILNIILRNTCSLAQLKHRLKILKSNLIKTFFGDQSDTESISPEDLNWLKSLPSDFYQKFNKNNVYRIFEDLDAGITKLQILSLYLTFEPDESALSQISAYARKTFNLPLLLLDIKLDPDLVAGTAISWKGQLRDYSLHAKMEEKKVEIGQGFRRFLR